MDDAIRSNGVEMKGVMVLSNVELITSAVMKYRASWPKQKRLWLCWLTFHGCLEYIQTYCLFVIPLSNGFVYAPNSHVIYEYYFQQI